MASHPCLVLLLALQSGVVFGDETSPNGRGFLWRMSTDGTKIFDGLLEQIPSQRGKCVAITGTSSGLGYWAAIATAKKGASCMIMLNRNSSKLAKALDDVKQEAAPGVSIFSVLFDLQDLSTVRDASAQVNEIAQKFGGIDVLALNAGIMAQPDVRTVDGFDVTMQTNHLSHFLLTKMLMPSLLAAASSRGEVRIVTQSSLARGGDPANMQYYLKSPAGSLGGDSDHGMERYHQSKLANIVFSMALHSKFAAAQSFSNFKSLSAAPGISATDLHFPMPKFLPKAIVDWFKDHAIMSAADGSCSLLTAMYAPSAKSGDFYEPKWMVSGPPARVIAEGHPDWLASLPRSRLFSVDDKASCTRDVGEVVWSASETGLGEKFIIENEGGVVV
eukprot:TRINITY_DN2594_c0_g1_i2.p1 TRINITY_DN2594_c0_g1~~TRINITY_DN2594_c0_g1_i2.p1  ORF type:complete len:388 (+),score=70.35 TRINITY_DN2594_c0_g1_i2:71-1234(+)